MALPTRQTVTTIERQSLNRPVDDGAHRVDGLALTGRSDRGPSLGPPGQAGPRNAPLTPLEPLRILGQTLMWLGSLLLLFAVFQLWGTGLLEWHAQRGLDAEFDQLLADGGSSADALTPPPRPQPPPPAPAPAPAPPVPATTASPVEPDPGRTAANFDSQPREGDPIARIDIPAIGVRKTIVQGVQRQTLRAGPGHYPTTPLPGQPGNTAIAGHRTTHGAPFLNIDQLEPGDHIDVETADGLYRYEVEGHEATDGTVNGHFIVRPSNVGVIGDHGDDRLTLTACHPRYSARERIIVTALLIDEPSPGPVAVDEPSAPPAEEPTDSDVAASPPDKNPEPEPDPVGTGEVDPSQTVGDEPNSLEESLGWRMDELDPALIWGTVTALVIHAGWVFGLLWRRRWAYAITTPLAAVPLFVCFIHLDRLLPAF